MTGRGRRENGTKRASLVKKSPHWKLYAHPVPREPRLPLSKPEPVSYGHRLLVFGGRDFTDMERAFAALSHLAMTRGVRTVAHGAAKGADSLARDWAGTFGFPQRAFPVTEEEWRTIGPRAGPLRNQRMLDEEKPTAAVGFPGGRGTADMARRLEAAGVPIWWPYGRGSETIPTPTFPGSEGEF